VKLMRFLELPHISQEGMVEMSSHALVRQARQLLRSGSVSEVDWQPPVLRGRVRGAAEYTPELNLKSVTFVRNSCGCANGRRGFVCEHALALLIHAQRLSQMEDAAPAPAPKPAKAEVAEAATAAKDERAAGPQSIRLGAGGELLEMRLHLPPNAESAIARGGMVLRLEVLLAGKATAPEKLFKGRLYAATEACSKGLALLEDWCGGALASMFQLKPARMAQLLEVMGDELSLVDARSGKAVGADRRAALEGRLKAAVAPAKAAVVARGVPRRAGKAGAVAVPRGRGTARGTVAPARMPSRDEQLPDNWMVIDGSAKFLAILLRERDHPSYRRCIEWLRAEGFRKEPGNGLWWLRDTHKVLNLLATRKRWIEEQWDPGYTRNFLQRMEAIERVKIHCHAHNDGSDYHLRMELEAPGLDATQLRRALLSGQSYVIHDERIFLIEEQEKEQFSRAAQALGGDPNILLTGLFQTKVGRAGVVDAQGILEDLEAEVALPADWKERSAAMRHIGELSPPPLPAAVGKRLRGYQLLGTAWLWHLLKHQLGGVLADEMGLGKTIQAIAMLLCWWQERDADSAANALIVVPASLIGNWRRELATWGGQLPVHIHHGVDRMQRLEAVPQSAVWVTSYSTLRNDGAVFDEREWALIFADEAQHIKNRRTQSARLLRALNAGSRFVLTGTPIENSIEDLRSLFDFCLPGYLGRMPGDARGEEREWYERRHLEKAAPYILRRSKAAVAPELPEKIEQTLYCTLSQRQSDLYERVQRKSEQLMMQLAATGASENRMRFTLLTELLRLRQVCADPGMVDEDFPLEASAKYRAFRELFEEAVDGGHRILLFSQFVKLLKRLRAALDADGIEYGYIDGSTRNRLAEVDRFNENPDIPICLISLKAGGTGLNLTGADTVIHFDPWWNPAVEDQATDRAHRIGQKRTVTSYKLVTEGTVEEKVLALQLKKAALLRDLLDESAAQSAKVDLATLQALLSRDAH
jgi:superfamily II DNA or RNA helicase